MKYRDDFHMPQAAYLNFVLLPPGRSSFVLLYLIHTFYFVKMVLWYCFLAKVLILTRRDSVLWQESSGS
jgi:hypothetical protein